MSWDGAAEILIDAARRFEAGGADFFLIGTNTMHQVADSVAAAIGIPLLHIADATGEVLRHNQVPRIGLLGTRQNRNLVDRTGDGFRLPADCVYC